MHSTIRELFHGNLEYMAKMSKENPGLLPTLAKEGQRQFVTFEIFYPKQVSNNLHDYLGPPFLLIDCSDSRVNEQAIFSAQPGTLFTAGNIANRFDEWDLNSCVFLFPLSKTHIVTPFTCPPLSYHLYYTHFFHIYSNSVLSFAVDSLKVKHVIVLGHYGCGGVAAAMMPLGKLPTRPADIAIQSWISPIRDIYETSERYATRR
jgi:carbonic anhydrase